MSRANNFLQSLPRLWFQESLSPLLLLLLPLSWLFRGLVAIRRFLYRQKILSSVALSVPVIVVGNLTVGGSGKTPLALWLVQSLRERGWHPGIISRGYGGEVGVIRPVVPTSEAAVVGDEPLLLAQRGGVPVFVGRDRVAAGNALLAAHPECDVLVSDDGLQHYRLERCVEIAVFDRRGAGNGRLLPAGPLREPMRRLSEVTAVVLNGGVAHASLADTAGAPYFSMCLVGQRFIALRNSQETCSAEDLKGKSLHALAGIGDPSRFFSQLSGMGLEFSPHPFPDHQAYSTEDLSFARDGVLLMTEKDAVKCSGLALPEAWEAWVLPVEARIDNINNAPDGNSLLDKIVEKLNGRTPA
ncbi:tetraacyldisaccharide 4'-kinase [Betaproteobacteria bacterium]|nr:tetraacyldisaccharide 4'-kinase [Betaproteobacteria bacterium]